MRYFVQFENLTETFTSVEHFFGKSLMASFNIFHVEKERTFTWLLFNKIDWIINVQTTL